MNSVEYNPTVLFSLNLSRLFHCSVIKVPRCSRLLFLLSDNFYILACLSPLVNNFFTFVFNCFSTIESMFHKLSIITNKTPPPVSTVEFHNTIFILGCQHFWKRKFTFFYSFYILYFPKKQPQNIIRKSN